MTEKIVTKVDVDVEPESLWNYVSFIGYNCICNQALVSACNGNCILGHYHGLLQ